MNNILSQAKTPTGELTSWCNEKVGFSENLFHSKGSQVVLLAEIMDLTPLEVNDKLKEVDGFNDDQILWEKVMLSFPGWAAQFIEPYNNNVVLEALANNQFVIVLTEDEKGNSHSVRYMGDGVCHDPKTGEEKPTFTYPNVKAMVVLTHIEQKADGKDEIVVEKTDPVTGENTETARFEVKPEVIEPKPLPDSPPTGAKEIQKQLKKIHVATLAIKRLL